MSWIVPVELGDFGTVYISRIPPSLRSKLPYVTTLTRANAYRFATKELAVEAQELMNNKHQNKPNYSNLPRMKIAALPVEEA